MIFWILVVIVCVVLYRIWLNSANPNTATQALTNAKLHAFTTFRDKYETIEEVQEALRAAGLESSNLIFAIDYTKSNEYNGKRTFGGKCLHHISHIPGEYNPYQQAIATIGRTLEPFDDDRLIPSFGFGDQTTHDRGVFSFFPDQRPCSGFAEVLARYTELTPKVVLSGPTSFAPVIYEAIKIVKESRQYHILVIVADGQVTNTRETIDAIVEASNHALSIIVVGVGDGPWEMMQEFDDQLPQRRFDNFQFVELHKVLTGRNPDVNFALAALQEIPDQFKAIRSLGLLG